MVHYKLIYFPFRARAEPARQLFALAGQEYEDVRYSMEEWPQHKGDTPFGQVPVLEVDGKQLGQSNAIYRYLGREFGFAGNSDIEEAHVDSVADLFQDYFVEYQSFFVVLVGFAPGDKDFLYNSVMVPARNKMFRILSNILKDNGTGYLVGNSVTYVDLLLSIHVNGMEAMIPGFANDFPRILEHRKLIESIPAIKTHIAMRPDAPF